MNARCRWSGAALGLVLVACANGAPQKGTSAPAGGAGSAGGAGAGGAGSAGSAGTSGAGGAGAAGVDAASSDAAPLDTSAPDAASLESGAPDLAGEVGASGCAGLLCEDFESGRVDADKWSAVASGGTMEVEHDVVAHGAYALHLHAQAGAGDWALLLAKSVPPGLAGTTTFGRVYFFITPKPLTSGHTQMVFAGRTGTGAANGPAPFPKLRYMEVANINGGWQLGFDLLDVGPLVEEVSYPKGQVPTSAWVCLEWEFEDHPDHITMWLDGAPAGTFDDMDIGYASPGPLPKPGDPIYQGKSSDIIGGAFDTFGFGFHDWHPNKPFDLYYDDLVLSNARVGCLK